MLNHFHEPVNGLVVAISACRVELHLFGGIFSSSALKRVLHFTPFDRVRCTGRTVDHRNAVSRSANYIFFTPFVCFIIKLFYWFGQQCKNIKVVWPLYKLAVVLVFPLKLFS